MKTWVSLLQKTVAAAIYLRLTADAVSRIKLARLPSFFDPLSNLTNLDQRTAGNEKRKFTGKNLFRLQSPYDLEEKMVKGLGRREALQRTLQAAREDASSCGSR